jgi:hypothetical protein
LMRMVGKPGHSPVLVSQGGGSSRRIVPIENECRGRNPAEIDRRNRNRVVAQESPPTLRRWPSQQVMYLQTVDSRNEKRWLFAMSHRAGVQMKWSCTFILALLLCGCITDQKKQVAACEINAKHAFPEKTFRGTSPSTDMADFIQACMRVAGYEFACGPDDISLSGDYFCYRPSSRLGRWAYEIERSLKQHGL